MAKLTFTDQVFSLQELSRTLASVPVKHLCLRDCRIVTDVPSHVALPGLDGIETLEVDCRAVGQLHALWMIMDDPHDVWNAALAPLRAGLRHLIVHGDLAVACLGDESLTGLRCVELVNGAMDVAALRDLLCAAPSLERLVVNEVMQDVELGDARPVRELPLSIELTLGVLDAYTLESIRVVQARACPVREVKLSPGEDAALILTRPERQAEAVVEWLTAGEPCPLAASDEATTISLVTTFNPDAMDSSTLSSLVQAVCALLPSATNLNLVCTDAATTTMTSEADLAVSRALSPNICHVLRRFQGVSA